MLKHHSGIFPLTAIITITLSVYFAGLFGDFMFDDEANIIRNPAIHLTSLDADAIRAATFSGTAGPLKRPIALFSFALNHYFSGLDPFYFKLTNLLIHLLVGLGIYWLCLLCLRTYRKYSPPSSKQFSESSALTDSRMQTISLLTTFAWLVNPVNLTAVLYVVQRMNSLSALFVIYGMLFYVVLRNRLSEHRWPLVPLTVGVLLFTALAALSKENGLLLPVYLLLLEIFLFKFKTETPITAKALKLLFLFGVGLPAVLGTLYFLVTPEYILNGYAHRPFSFEERLMTEARVFWFYLQLIILPSLSSLGLFHDDIAISTSLLAPTSTLLSVISLALLFFLIIRLRNKLPIATFSMAFFLVSHSMESSVFALELVHEHRNYIGSFGILFMLIYYATGIQTSISSYPLRWLLLIPLLFLSTATTLQRAMDWGNPGRFALMEATHHPQSARANQLLGLTFLKLAELDSDHAEDHRKKAINSFITATNLDSSYTDGLFAVLRTNTLNGQIVLPSTLDKLEQRLRYSHFNSNITNWLDRLVSCRPNPACVPPTPMMVRILEAAMKNPTVFGKYKQELFTIASKFEVEIQHNLPRAFELISIAAAVSSAPRYKLHAATLLSLMGRPDQAQQYLADAESHDQLGVHTKQIQQLKQTLKTLPQTPP